MNKRDSDMFLILCFNSHKNETNPMGIYPTQEMAEEYVENYLSDCTGSSDEYNMISIYRTNFCSEDFEKVKLYKNM